MHVLVVCPPVFWRACLLVALVAPPLSAEEVSLDALPEWIRRRSPELQALRADRRVEEARRDAAGWRPEAQMQVEVLPALASGGVGTVQAGLERPLTRASRLEAERQAARQRLPVWEAQLRRREAELVREAREAAVEWLIAPRRAELLARRQTAAKELADILAGRAAAGEVSALEAGEARLDLSRLEREALRVEWMREQAKHTLRGLLDWPEDKPLEITGTLDDPREEQATPASVAPSWAVEEARAEAEAAMARAAADREGATPESSVSLIAALERDEDEPGGVGQEAFVGVAYSHPLPVPGKAEAQARIGLEEAARWRKEAEHQERAARHRLAALRAEMRQHARLFAAAGGAAIREAEAHEQAAERAYREGQADVATWLRARAHRLALEEDRLQALRDYHLARSRLPGDDRP